MTALANAQRNGVGVVNFLVFAATQDAIEGAHDHVGIAGNAAKASAGSAMSGS